MTTPRDEPRSRVRAVDAARNLARRAAFTLARDAGARTITRPAFLGSPANVQDVEPLAGMRAARDLEVTARQAAHDYIRAAREAGHSWHDIGTALELRPNADAQQVGDTASETAFTYATSSPNTETAWRYSRSVIWTCPSCDKTVRDLGPCNGPADDERGHALGCRRLEATIAAHETEWAAFDAEWEAGA